MFALGTVPKVCVNTAKIYRMRRSSKITTAREMTGSTWANATVIQKNSQDMNSDSKNNFH